MKKLKLIILVVMVLLLCGCMKYDTEMTINKDKSMDLNITFVYNPIIFGYEEDEELLLINDYMRDKGFYINYYYDVKYLGYTYSKHIVNIDDLSVSDNVTYNASNIYKSYEPIFEKKEHLFYTSYTAKIYLPADDYFKIKYENIAQDKTKDGEIFYDNAKISFKLNLPYRAISDNSLFKENNGKTLEWDITEHFMDDIEFTFPIYNIRNITIAIVIFVIIMVILTMVLIIINKRKNKKLLRKKSIGEVSINMNNGEEL